MVHKRLGKTSIRHSLVLAHLHSAGMALAVSAEVAPRKLLRQPPAWRVRARSLGMRLQAGNCTLSACPLLTFAFWFASLGLYLTSAPLPLTQHTAKIRARSR